MMSTMYTPDQILRLAEARASHIKRSLMWVSKEATGTNHEVFRRMKRGCSCRTDTLIKASDWFDANADRAWWPDDVPWPAREAAE